MSKKDLGSSGSTNLRKRAEDKVLEGTEPARENGSALNSEDAQKLIHELKVHQIELEMQTQKPPRC